MPAKDKAEANFKRREKYRSDQVFCNKESSRVAAWRKDKRDNEKAMQVLTGALRMTVLDLEQASGVSRYQIARLEKDGVIPAVQRRESDGAMIFTIAQILWICLALKFCRCSLQHQTKVAYRLDALKNLLDGVWLAPYNADVGDMIPENAKILHALAIDQRILAKSPLNKAYRLAKRISRHIPAMILLLA